ncbi:MAG: alpha/beta hydrolase, partial [Ignavibacteria bacterium]|nr:alpha/beta hydrolase [Ignavibacteria bacterium]
MRASYKIDLLKILMLFVVAYYISSCAQSIPALKYTTHGLTYAYSPDIEINYEMIGYGRKKIVFVHGFGTSLHTWDDIKELFPKDEFTLYLLDMKGFGNSSKPEDDRYSIQEQANIAAGFIRKINSKSVYLIGHSYGGGVALHTDILLAKDKSKKWIYKLVLIDL